MPTTPPPQLKRRHDSWAIIFCALLLMTFAALAWLAALGKSATFDEPLDVMGAWANTRLGDYRLIPGDPPLWSYWAGLALGREDIKANLKSPTWKESLTDLGAQYAFSSDTLYRTAGNDADALLRRSRAMMLILGLLLGAVIAAWSWKLGGAAAAIAATTCFCLDPNFLAHAPLVKNDVSMTLVAIAMFAIAWSVGRRARVWNVALLALLCGVAVCVKFTGIVLILALVIVLLARVWMPIEWNVLGRTINRRSAKFGSVVLILAVCLAVSYAMIWGTYRFRFDPSPDASVRMDLHAAARECISTEMTLANPNHQPTPQEISSRTPPLPMRVALFADQHHLLPQAWTYGFAITYARTRMRKAYLLGEIRDQGWWYYFPMVMLFKTPIATLAAMLLMIELGIAGWRNRSAKSAAGWWSAICIAAPVAIVLFMAMIGRIDIGIRHILVIYPFIFIAIGVAFARLWHRRRMLVTVIGLLLAIGLLVETAAAFPNYIAFFNAASGGSRAGVDLLGDSNLDWGQDLPLLRLWQDDHPDKPIYLCYFGCADPAYYHIAYVNLPESDASDRSGPRPNPRRGGVIAISATQLQGIYLTPNARSHYERLRSAHPIDVLGGSIYIYDISDLR